MRESCTRRLASKTDADWCDARPECVADRLNEMCIDIPDCGVLAGSKCEQVAGCFFDGRSCVSAGLRKQPATVLPRVANVPTRPSVPVPSSAPAPAGAKPVVHSGHMRRYTHLCVPHATQAPTMLATSPNQCKYPCEDIVTFQECTQHSTASRMCHWEHDKCRALPKKYEIVDQQTNPGRFADLLQQKSASLVTNPNT